MAEPGNVAVVHVEARVAEGEDAGETFETTDVDVALESGSYDPHRDYTPMEFRVGAGEVPPAIDDAVRDLSVGEERTVTADPEDAFGPRDEGAVVEVDWDDLGDGDGPDAAVGKPVTAETGEVGWITDANGDVVTVDFNHEFAGQPVTFVVRLLDEREPSAGDD
ncbi:FKBP-type peptidyl-prolyl cis-trans isomerase [Halorarum salinum]|uniref:Peptidyl-prolyl cis-trans isomerase n=1 Tax=Halorarum salinum TaxID=2743089 RepID=A0A7D5QL02_9EURY|nr:FKBP-type peptidyl-prolyl cis-trans isomerase [Halobaculum salinum]QLG62505.1 FKBP-type peptidyl-prolyl cis-trans isomerase [Halobaculum salinum]